VGFRGGNPSTDKDLNGNPIQRNYTAFVWVSDCKKYEKDGKNYYNPDKAPCIPVTYSETGKAYGKWQKRNSSIGTWAYDSNTKNWIRTMEYWQSTVYEIKGGKVYTGSLKSVQMPNAIQKQILG
jgi:hypothetical protein